jgi:hypothetical protein
MKAEQRKELETNTLADKMGHVMQRVKTSPRRTFMTYLVIAAVVIFGLWFGYRWWLGVKAETSLQWLRLYDGAGGQMEELIAKDRDTQASKAARFQKIWIYYWDYGVKMAASDQKGSLMMLKQAVQDYTDLAEDCKGDPVFEPQALLGRAVAQETMAVQDRDHLKKAEQFYEEILTINDKKYEKSAEGKFALQRLDILRDKTKKAELSATYADLQKLLRVPARDEPRFDPKLFHPGFEKDKK